MSETLTTETVSIEGYETTLIEERVQTRRQVPWDATSRDEYRVTWSWHAPSDEPGYVISEPRNYDSRDEAEAAARSRLWIHSHLRGLDQSIDRATYERRCAAAGVEAESDTGLAASSYAMERGDFWMAHYSPEQTVAGELAQRRYRALREATAEPNTQAAAIQAMGVDAVAVGGVEVGGALFKPDAQPDSRGACDVCGRAGVWISGAGRHLCAAHQDDY